MDTQTCFHERQAVLMVGLLTLLSGCLDFGPAPDEPCQPFIEECAPPTGDAAPQSWSHTGNTQDSRFEGHTATLLPSGKVLVAGGSAARSARATAELYDPGAGTWSLTSNLIGGRESHTATLLPSGKVLVAGGYHPLGTDGWGSPYLATAELYDPGTGTWSPTGPLIQGRRGHTATLLPSGKVLVVGGSGDASSGGVSGTAELYDPETGTWSPTGGPTSRLYEHHTATLLKSGKVLAMEESVVELYDPETGTWSPTGSPESKRLLHTATLLPSGKVLVAGGLNGSYGSVTAELYDPGTGTWSRTGSLSDARRNHTATLLSSGKVLVASGYFNTTSELYDPETGTWSFTTGKLSNDREKGTATLLVSGKVLLVGGGWPFGEVYTP
ncbi:Kelch repeat-containing protein [Archangium violaceum]|uniref:Kelch repeat-containing protein n=1 Tax=Archangium violaceum TaxID=83451 RepID=UPI0036DAC4C6